MILKSVNNENGGGERESNGEQSGIKRQLLKVKLSFRLKYYYVSRVPVVVILNFYLLTLNLPAAIIRDFSFFRNKKLN